MINIRWCNLVGLCKLLVVLWYVGVDMLGGFVYVELIDVICWIVECLYDVLLFDSVVGMFGELEYVGRLEICGEVGVIECVLMVVCE